MIIVSPARSITKSSEFYLKLDFEILAYQNRHYAMSNGIKVELNTDSFSRPGLRFLVKSYQEAKDKLENYGPLHFSENEFILSDPSGIRIYISDKPDTADSKKPESNSILGNFAGVSIESTDMSKSLEFYTSLGFKTESGNPEAGWLSLKDSSGNSISIMKANSCPHSFFNPSLTFFNSGKNIEVIDKIRQVNIPIKEEVTVFNKEGIVDNVILQDPGGIGFFVFND